MTPILSHPRYRPAENGMLGAGAQGIVVRVTDKEAPERPLVAKILRGAELGSGALAGEFALLARLSIPGLVRAHDFAKDDISGAPFIVEDFVDGPDVGKYLGESEGAQKNSRLSEIVADVALTLGRLHEAGFVHGDLKPEHVRVPSGGRTVVLDLGAAVVRAKNTQAVGLTRAYAAPEILAGGAVTAAADLFGLGALAWGAATGSAPPRGARGALRDREAWIAPSVADVIEALLAEHPADRPRDTREVLARLGKDAPAGAWESRRGAPVGRERAFSELLRGTERVRYVTGPAGAGKSHLVRELVTATLLAGRTARLLRFPSDDALTIARLVAFFRGAEEALPFDTPQGSLLIVLDELQAAPAELASALDAFRCRSGFTHVHVVATARDAPDGAAATTIGPLDEDAFGALALELGVGASEVPRLREESGALPGWLVAARGRVPLTRDAALERTRGLSPHATEGLATVALALGEAPEGIVVRVVGEPATVAFAELLAASLLTRHADDRGVRYALTSGHLAADLARALASYALVDRVADAMLDGDASAAHLLAIAGAPSPPTRRAELLRRCASRAQAEGLRTEEVEALFALAAEPRERSGELLTRLERLTRDAGMGPSHPRVLAWLEDVGQSDARIRPLALRRRAEAMARAGDSEGARAVASSARDAARELGDPAAEGFAIATVGAVALYRADWETAERALMEARSMAVSFAHDDPEEMARLDHNLGVVLLYRARHHEAAAAFERSLAIKRTLGDKAGCRACLLNLGLALTRCEHFEEAERALDEAILLARALGQTGGRGWCLAARADLDLRRGRTRDAERWTAEARALGDALPAAVRQDLAILRAEIAVAEGDGRFALEALDALDPSARKNDALTDARAHVLEARAHLAKLPADHRSAARAAIRGVRRARGAGLPEPEHAAVETLQRARARTPMRYVSEAMPVTPARPPAPGPSGHDAPLWAWIAALSAGATIDEAATSLAGAIVALSGAERAFVALAGDAGDVTCAWGADLDGLPIADAEKRVQGDALATAMRKDGPLYQREVTSPAGTGSRLAVASPRGPSAPRAVIVVEHRFLPARFDRVSPDQATRWAALGSLVARLRLAAPSSSDLSATATSHHEPKAHASWEPAPAETTSLPLREVRRSFPTILGESAPLRRALARLDAAIDSDLPVLITGETGVGKEVFARALHDMGPRAARPFVAVNCAAIPDALFEAELFGHARGSFTGADRARPGLLARAQGGTLLLDEVGELPPLRQATLLRALESRRYRSVGSDDERVFDARIVAATNCDLEKAVQAGQFRQDLLFRLQVLDIRIPPLRDRPDDIPMLARTFLERAAGPTELSSGALAALTAHAWPGNVRELEHQMQRLSTIGAARIALEHLPRDIRAARRPSRRSLPERSREEVERDDVAHALAATGGNITHAAARLGLTRHGLKKRMLRLGMRAQVSGDRR